MPEEVTYKITCDVCGYSEVVSASRLAYEEGKTCPRCYKGKMYWVPPTEEARRREVKVIYGQRSRTMPEEREISPLWIIPIGIILGIGAGLGLLVALAREKETPPEEGPPEEGPPVVIANIFGIVTHAETGTSLAGVSVELWSPDGAELILSTTTDSSGHYSIANVLPGNYLVYFKKEGYETRSDDVVLVEGNNDLNVRLTPIGLARFYVPPEMTKELVDGTILGMYWDCKVWCPITNNGDARGTHIVHVWDSVGNIDYEFELTLNPGETYTWDHHQWIDFRRISTYSVHLEGDWEENNYSKATFP